MSDVYTFHRARLGSDAAEIRALGVSTPELDVGGARGGMMTLEEIEDSIRLDQIWIVAKNNDHVVGFAHINLSDSDRAPRGSACLVYFMMAPEHRRAGCGKKLYQFAFAEAYLRGVRHLYTWANSSAAPFFMKQGLSLGKVCFWMDVEL